MNRFLSNRFYKYSCTGRHKPTTDSLIDNYNLQSSSFTHISQQAAISP